VRFGTLYSYLIISHRSLLRSKCKHGINMYNLVAYATGILMEVCTFKRNVGFINEELQNPVLTPKSRTCSHLKYTCTVSITIIPTEGLKTHLAIHYKVLLLCTDSVK
jgi:hypothetical protein